jgi:hypothetical protein
MLVEFGGGNEADAPAKCGHLGISIEGGRGRETVTYLLDAANGTAAIIGPAIVASAAAL